MGKDISNEELLGAIVKGFTTVEKKIDDKIDGVEERLGMKIDGVRSSLDAEILRRVDDYAKLDKRITKLEGLHGLKA